MTKTIHEMAEENAKYDTAPYCASYRNFVAGANAVLEKVVKHLDKIDVDNHDYEDLEDLYDWLCEMVKQLKGE